MRVIIISDMEGISGIVKWEQVKGGDPMYEECRKLYTEEINAAVRGAISGGASEVVVMDCHGAGGGWSFNSLVPDMLDPRCEYVVQQIWTGYTGALEQGCDAALFIGMHAMAGTPMGVLSHTVSSEAWHNLWFNNIRVGETGINAALCGNWGCPVLLVTGDKATCDEARALLGDDLMTVAVKEGLGRNSARQIPPQRARQMIEDAAKKAIEERPSVLPYNPGEPCEIKVEVVSPDRVEPYRHKAGVHITEPRVIVSQADDWWSAWKQFWL
ncbi:MAG: M55 family metallopeptidase [Chloroflexota bacterium]|nr:M55 family metallopeptidase [Chloroflexota bacterium]